MPTAALTLAGSLVFLAVSYVEHINSVRPSFLLSTYLFSTVIFDIARTRTLWLMQNDQAIAIVFSATLAFKVVILSLEAMSKREVLRLAYEAYPPEATGGLFSTYLFLWLNRLFRRGYSNLLLLEDLFPLDKHLFSQYVERLLNFRVTKGKTSYPPSTNYQVFVW